MLDDDDNDNGYSAYYQDYPNEEYVVYRDKWHGPWCVWYGNDTDYTAQGKVKINFVHDLYERNEKKSRAQGEISDVD